MSDLRLDQQTISSELDIWAALGQAWSPRFPGLQARLRPPHILVQVSGLGSHSLELSLSPFLNAKNVAYLSRIRIHFPSHTEHAFVREVSGAF